MKVKLLFEKIIKNWPAKVLCFSFALILYFVHITSLLDTKTYTIPLNIDSSSTMFPVTDYPEYVRVTVRSTTENISETLQDDFSATLDLKKYQEEGSFSVPITVKLSKKILQMDSYEVSVKPETVQMKLEEKIIKYISVSPSISGEVEYGYSIKNTTVLPSTVEVIGPRSVLEATKQIYTSQIDVNALTESKVFQTTIKNINSLIEMNNSYLYTVNVEIEAEPLVRSFTNIPISILFLQANLETDGADQLLSIELSGTVPVLEDFTLEKNAVFVDCSSITEPGEYELPLEVTLPKSLTIENQSTQSVRVIVRERVKNTADSKQLGDR